MFLVDDNRFFIIDSKERECRIYEGSVCYGLNIVIFLPEWNYCPMDMGLLDLVSISLSLLIQYANFLNLAYFDLFYNWQTFPKYIHINYK